MSTATDTFIPLSVPELRGNEWSYIKDCLDTGWVSSVGSYVDRFEADFAQRIGTSRAVACVNGTSALHIALLVSGVEPDDEVLVSTLTFIAPVNAIRYANAWPVFIDSEESTWNMDPEAVRSLVDNQCTFDGTNLRNSATGRRIKAILPVHILGHPVDMDPIVELATKYRLAVIEDATESLGALYKGRTVGRLGDISCFSFNGNKLLTTGGGGMIVSDNPNWSQRCKYLTTQAMDDPVEYIHNEVGYNYRLTNLQAAMGCAQLEQIDDYLQAKQQIADRYDEALRSLPGVELMPRAEWAKSALWLYTIRLHSGTVRRTARQLQQILDAQRIQTRPLWQPNHLSPAHRQPRQVPCPVAERLFEECLSLPCSVGLTDSQQARVIEVIQSALN